MSCKKGKKAKNANKGNPDTLLGDPVANTATCIEKAKEKGQKDKIGIDDIGIFEFIFYGLPELPELEGIDEDRLRELQNAVQEQLCQRDKERERNITKRVQEFKKTFDFVNSHLLKGVATMAEITKTDNRQPMGKIKPTDKMVMMASLFDGTKKAINTSGDIVDQKKDAKKEKFIETMPMIIQTHLIICKDWADVKDKAKSLKHIIRKCDPPTPTMPLMATGTTVLGLYSHIAHLVDKEEGEIPQLFKGAKPKQTRGRGKPKGKPHEQRQNPPKAQEADEMYAYESPNNYYHNDYCNALSQSQGRRPFTGQGGNQ